MDPFEVKFLEGTHKDIIKSTKENLPSLALYNSLLPFLVSVIEHFFTELFTLLVEFDEIGKLKIQELKLRELKNFNTIQDIYQIKKDVFKIERQIAKAYNFQNLEIVNQTFSKFLNIDIKKILKDKSILKHKKIDLFETLHEIIERRHWMIHHFGFASDLDKEKFQYFLDITSATIDVIIIDIEKTKKINVLDQSFHFDGLYKEFLIDRK